MLPPHAFRVLVTAAMVALTTTAEPHTAAAAPLFPVPDSDEFYSAPGDIARHKDGDVLRARPMPAPMFPGAAVWQLLYRSRNSAGRPIAAVTTLLVPGGAGVNRPLLSYQAFINSLGTQCAPSHSLFNGTLQEAPALNLFLQRGWAVAVPDHLGPTSAYGAARLGGRLVLDGLRAVKRFGPATLGGSPVGMAGYSGGGIATGWAAALAPTYAPELPIVGAAQGGVPVDMGQLMLGVDPTPSPLFGIGFGAAMGLEREYPTAMHFSNHLDASGLAMRSRIANACVDDIVAAGADTSLRRIGGSGLSDVDASTENVLRMNSLDMYSGVPHAPIYQWHGAMDHISPVPARAMAGRYCRSGVRLLFEIIPGADHGAATLPGAGKAIGYLADRFADLPAPNNCRELSR